MGSKILKFADFSEFLKRCSVSPTRTPAAGDASLKP
jgi:hypothetical protein